MYVSNLVKEFVDKHDKAQKKYQKHILFVAWKITKASEIGEMIQLVQSMHFYSYNNSIDFIIFYI